MKDFQRGWYIQLLLEMTRSENIGFLLLDNGRLWRLAGAVTRQMWDHHSGLVMACFKVQEISGCRWIYNDTLLAELRDGEQLVENKQRRNACKVIVTSSLSISIYEEYPRKEGRSKALQEIEKAIDRVADSASLALERQAQGIEYGDRVAAAKFIHERVLLFAKSPAGTRPDKQFIPHPSTWFHQDRFLDDQHNWEMVNVNGTNKAEQRQAANLRAREQVLADMALGPVDDLG